MIINKPGTEFIYEGVTYRIGDEVIGTAESAYEGLFGIITEIRDGEDRETDNSTPDLYCVFNPPTFPEEIRRLEERFSALYRNPKTLDEICLDMVIMAPSMVQPLSGVNGNKNNLGQ